jgi:dCTP deaminase
MTSESASTAAPLSADARPAIGAGALLSSQSLRRAVADGIVSAADDIPDSSFQPASIDLRLGPVAYRLRCSFLPGPRQTVAESLADYAMGKLSLEGEGAVLDQNRPYLIPLLERVHLPPAISARANPRSSTGRLDVFTRVVTDRSEQFDDIAAGYSGQLFLEVVPRSFTIRVAQGLALSQLRLQTGPAGLSDAEVAKRHALQPLLFAAAGEPVPAIDLRLRGGLFLSIDLSAANSAAGGVVGYRAKKNSHLLDLTARDLYDARDFWEPVVREPRDRVVLEPEDFYLLYAKELVRLPPDLAAEMVPFDPSAGEMRTHYAGFFDPGFGQREEGKAQGARAVLEVRAHDVPFVVSDGQRLCKLALQRLDEPSARPYGPQIGSRYHSQRVVLLPRQFKQPSGLQPTLWDL